MWDDNYPIPQRRKNRLSGIRYSENGAYFITICTREHNNLFWKDATVYVPCGPVGAALRRPPDSADTPAGAALRRPPDSAGTPAGAALRRPPDHLNANGTTIIRELDRFSEIYQGVITVDNYVIMPNHVHLLLTIHPENLGGRRNAAPTIPSVINQFKGCVTKRIGFPCWQKSFHDHVVRNEDEYRRIWEYIDNNPAKWAEDRYYIPPGE